MRVSCHQASPRAVDKGQDRKFLKMGAYGRFGISADGQNNGWEQMGAVSHDIPALQAIAKYILCYCDVDSSCCVAEMETSALSLRARHKIPISHQYMKAI